MLIPRIGDDVIQKIIKCDLFNLHPMYKGGYKSYLRASKTSLIFEYAVPRFKEIYKGKEILF